MRELGLFSVEKSISLGETLSLYNTLKGGCRKVVISFISQATSDKTRENGLKQCKDRFMLGIKKNFFTERVVRH